MAEEFDEINNIITVNKGFEPMNTVIITNQTQTETKTKQPTQANQLIMK